MTEASRLFAEQGYDGTTVEALAAAAGISPPTIYKHFPAKHAVLLAVTDRATRTSQARRSLGATEDLASQLAALFAEYLAVGQIQRRRLSIELSRAALRNHEVAASLATYNRELRDSLAATIRHTRPSFSRNELELLAHLFLVLLMGAIHLDTLDADLIGDDQLVAFLHERFAVLLATDPPRVPATRRPNPPTRPAEPEPTDGRRARTVRTRRRILDAAAELFALHGYDATSIDMIAARADITVPAIYLHVESKEALLVEVARRAFDSYRRLMPFGEDRVPGPGGVVADISTTLGDFAGARNRVRRRLAVELDFGAWRSAELRDALRTFHREVRAGVAESLTGRVGHDHTSADYAAMVVLLLFMGSAHVDTVDPVLVDNDKWRAFLRRRVPQLIGPPQRAVRQNTSSPRITQSAPPSMNTV